MADLEHHLYEWYEVEYVQKKVPVSRSRIILKAKEIYANMAASDEDTAEDFKFCKVWLDKFFQRHGIVQRQTTSVCQRPPADYQEKLVSFVLYVSRKIASGKYGSNLYL